MSLSLIHICFNIENANGEVVLRLSTFVPFLLVAVCIGIMVLLINSTYGRAFKAIREDEVAAEAMGINLAKHKRMAFCISSFFAGVGGGLFAKMCIRDSYRQGRREGRAA